MSKTRGVLKGFIAASVVCVVSFVAIYFVFPDVSERFFKTSFKNRVARVGADEAGAAAGAAKGAAREAGERIDKSIDKADGILDDNLVRKTSEKVDESLKSIKNQFD